MASSVDLTVTGMKCGGCEANITGKLTALPGVSAVTAAHKENKVSVQYDAAQVSPEQIIQTITAAGFKVI
jgi:copper chaperone CopZ